MRHGNGAGERVSGWAHFSGVFKAVGLFDACFGGLTVALPPSCRSKLRRGGHQWTSWFGLNPQHHDRWVAETSRGGDG